MKKNYKYMHTVDGRPGFYEPGRQICFFKSTQPIPLVDSLKQIKKEQKASAEWRRSKGFSSSDAENGYGWMKVLV